MEEEVKNVKTPVKAPINSWQPTASSRYVTKDNKIFYVYFEKIFPTMDAEKLKKFDKFIIGKLSYIKQLDTITRYINFFIHFYDKDLELPSAYLALKFCIDKKDEHFYFDADSMDAFIDYCYKVMFTPSMVENIQRMVEENYVDDIETPSGKKSKYKANEKKHLESLEFTNQHIKILLAISFGMKILSPVMLHFCAKNQIELKKGTMIIYQFYKGLFPLFEGDCNMFNKLYVYVKTKVLESNSTNSVIFRQREIFGVDLYDLISRFTKLDLISGNMMKYKFAENWNPKLKKYEESIVGFNKTLLKYQLHYFLKEQYDKNLTEVSPIKNADGLSGIDKMAINMEKIDQGSAILNDLNIEDTMLRIRHMMGFDIPKEEIDYYMQHLNITDLHRYYLYLYFAKFFTSISYMETIAKRDLIELILILKRCLLLDYGYTDTKDLHECCLPYLLSGNLDERVINKAIRNAKFHERDEASEKYRRLVEKEYASLLSVEGKEDSLKNAKATFLHSQFSYVSFSHPELNGTPIPVDEYALADELNDFFNEVNAIIGI